MYLCALGSMSVVVLQLAAVMWDDTHKTVCIDLRMKRKGELK